MGISDIAGGVLDKAKAALDENGDGTVQVGEVAGAVANRAKEVAEAAAQAAGEVKAGFDADGDGKVSVAEVKVVADAVAKKATGAVSGLADKLRGTDRAED